MAPSLQEARGIRIAVEGCGHGTLNAIYSSVEKACEARGWNGVDLLIIGGDFQAVRNASDLTVMSCPVKFREIGDFHSYYSGSMKAPYLTIFVGGNHEASSHMWELYYGGWAAPNIYYMGAANVVRLGGIRIAGMSGIWKGYNFNKTHYERLPYNQDDVKSIYHIREIDTRKLLQLRTQVDVGISHDWPRAIEKGGDQAHLYRMKPDFEQESRDGILGSFAAAQVMDRLRPPYWFSAHLHCKFSALKTYEDEHAEEPSEPSMASTVTTNGHSEQNAAGTSNGGDVVNLVSGNAQPSSVTDSLPHNSQPLAPVHNDDEIDLDMDDDDEQPVPQVTANQNTQASYDTPVTAPDQSAIPLEIRSQLPAAFSRPARRVAEQGNPPPEITNKTVRFLALDKCLPGRKFLQLLEIPVASKDEGISGVTEDDEKPKFEYDPEWLAITRVFAPELILGDKSARNPDNLGEGHYRAQIEKEREWVNEKIVKKGALAIPSNFELTAPVFEIGMPEIVQQGPLEYNNPQTQAFCDLVGIENKFASTDEEKAERIKTGPAPMEERRFEKRGGRGGSRGGHRGGGGRGGRGAHGRGRGRGGGRW